MPSAIEVSGLLFEYPGVRALDDVSFNVAAGSVTALVGPNGAGKTTLLRCLAGLEVPLSGNIEVAGVDVLEEPRMVHRRIGYLSDFYGLYDALTVRQCFAHAAAAHGVPEAEIEPATGRTAERLDLDRLVDRRASELSRGQRQRVAIGQALIHNPQVLMLDEPASGLDPEARHSLAILFKRLAAGGMTLLVSSHILAELDEYSTDMLVMREGRILESKPLAAAALEAARVRIEFAMELSGLEGKLRTIAGLTVVESGARDALVEIAGNAEARAGVLRLLVEAGLPVSAFASERQNLNESYLRTVASRVPEKES